MFNKDSSYKSLVVMTSDGDYYFDSKIEAENFAKLRNGVVEKISLRRSRWLANSFKKNC